MAHIDPVTGEIVPCETVYVGPLEYAKQLKRLMELNPGCTTESIAEKLNKDVTSVKRILYVNQMDREEKIDYLSTVFIQALGITDTSVIGRSKAILKELLKVIQP